MNQKLTYEEKLILDEKLIRLVQDNPVLYDKSSRGYKNVSRKAEIWNDISTALEQTEIYCTSRWRALRDKFAREVRELKTKPSASATRLRSEWDIYPLMLFLKDHVAPKSTKGNFNEAPKNLMHSSVTFNSVEDTAIDKNCTIEEEVIEDKAIQWLDDSNDTSSTRSSAKRKKSDNKQIGQKLLESMDSFKTYVESRKAPIAEDNYMDKSLLNGIRNENKDIAKKKVLQYLCQCQIKDLNEQSIERIAI